MKIHTQHALLALILLSSQITLETAQASIYSRSCSEPDKPSCIGMLGISRDQFSFDMCRIDVDRFRRDTEEYLSCLDKKKDEAIEEFNKSIQEYNCYANGSPVC